MGKKNWLTDSTGSTWWSESRGSSSGFTETTTQGESKYSRNWTLTEPNHTKIDRAVSIPWVVYGEGGGLILPKERSQEPHGVNRILQGGVHPLESESKLQNRRRCSFGK